MDNKKEFIAPKAEIIRFPKQDIVTTSGGQVSDDSVDEYLSGGYGIRLPDANW